jgi:hypothetical protein
VLATVEAYTGLILTLIGLPAVILYGFNLPWSAVFLGGLACFALALRGRCQENDRARAGEVTEP